MRRLSFRALACALGVLALAACDRDPSQPEPEALRFAEVVFEDEAGNLVYSHADHWHGFLSVRNGQSLPLRMYFVAQGRPIDEHGPPAREQWFTLEGHDAYRVRTTFQDPTLASWTGDRHQAVLQGRFAGSTGASWVVLRGTATQYQTPPTSVVVRP